MSSNLTVIEEIEKFEKQISSKSTVPFTGSILIKKSEIQDILETIREHLPSEFEQCRKLVSDVESLKSRTEAVATQHLEAADKTATKIVEDARTKAEEMLTMAEKKSAELVSSHSVTQRARQQAQTMLASAERDSNAMLEGAYTRSVRSIKSALADIERLKIGMQQSLRQIDEEETRRRAGE